MIRHVALLHRGDRRRLSTSPNVMTRPEVSSLASHDPARLCATMQQDSEPRRFAMNRWYGTLFQLLQTQPGIAATTEEASLVQTTIVRPDRLVTVEEPKAKHEQQPAHLRTEDQHAEWEIGHKLCDDTAFESGDRLIAPSDGTYQWTPTEIRQMSITTWPSASSRVENTRSEVPSTGSR